MATMPRSWGVLAQGLGLLAAAGCNAVLGIEEAKVDSTLALTCELPSDRPAERCAQDQACEDCVADCDVGACIASPNCRRALVDHRICVGDGCVDDDGSCSECLAMVPGAECLSGCRAACDGKEMVSLKELFCACMAAHCGGVPDCNTVHAETEDWELECLLTHCERAASIDSDHCLHAKDGELRQCTEKQTPVATCTASQSLLGYGCDTTLDCCNGTCNGGTCR